MRCSVALVLASLLLLVLLVVTFPAGAFAKTVQASFYSDTVTATGKRITASTHYVAVPKSRVVRKATWNRLSRSERKTHFYYGERLRLKHGKYSDTVTVQDCGSFGSRGQWHKGKWCPRMFDVTPAVRRKLHISKEKGTALVTYKVIG